MRYVVDITQSFSIEMHYYFQSSLCTEIAVWRVLENFVVKDFCVRNSWMHKQYITLAGTCVCFPTPFSCKFYFSYPNLMTVARIPIINYYFFSKKRDLLVMTSKTPDKEYFVRPFASDAQLEEYSNFSQSITRYSEVCLVTTQLL